MYQITKFLFHKKHYSCITKGTSSIFINIELYLNGIKADWRQEVWFSNQFCGVYSPLHPSHNYLFHFLLGTLFIVPYKKSWTSMLNPSLYRCWGQRSTEPLTTRFLTIDVKRHVHKGSRDVWNKGSRIRNFIFFTYSLTYNKGKPHSTNT